MARSGSTASVPLIRLSAFNPFLQELLSRNVDASKLLEAHGLPAGFPASSELFVSALSMYTLVEQSAVIADDPFFGATVGGNLDSLAWEPLSAAAAIATTVGELLNRIIVNATDHTSGTVFSIKTAGDRSTFGFARLIDPTFAPAQNDAFYLGYMVNLLKSATGDYWRADQVLVRLSDPAAVPPKYRNLHIAKGDDRGFSIAFPAEWLFAKFEKNSFAARAKLATQSYAPHSLLESVRTAIEPHIHECDLTVGKAADLCGLEKRHLSRRLKNKGTTLAKEIVSLREARASKALAETNERVADVGMNVGFKDPTVFSRAFKNWTGHSPQAYRRTHQTNKQTLRDQK